MLTIKQGFTRVHGDGAHLNPMGAKPYQLSRRVFPASSPRGVPSSGLAHFEYEPCLGYGFECTEEGDDGRRGRGGRLGVTSVNDSKTRLGSLPLVIGMHFDVFLDIPSRRIACLDSSNCVQFWCSTKAHVTTTAG